MRDETSWDFFFRTGLPEAYLLAKHHQKIRKETELPLKPSSDASQHQQL